MTHASYTLNESQRHEAAHWLHRAARAALRGMGHVEPNPMVGCALVMDGKLLAIGHHQRFGGLHAEREALQRCRALGHDPAGATAYVTLEPCRHTGKQPPCTDALIQAGIARVVAARPDPGPESGGGFALLQQAGIESAWMDWQGREHDALAWRIADPFVHRLRTGRPWVIAKWAQTLDGKIATRTGASQWISSPQSRARVHRLRSHVDAIMTGSGTVLADNPMLNVRRPGKPSPRVTARRVVLDSQLRLPVESKLAQSASELPVTVYTSLPSGAAPEASLAAQGVEVVAGLGGADGRVDAKSALADLWQRHGVATVLVEGGPTLLGSLLEAGLIDRAVVYVAPMVIGDDQARSVAAGRRVEQLRGAIKLALLGQRGVGPDLELWYRTVRESG